MNDKNDQEVLEPLRDLTAEITRKYVSEIVKESTKQAIRKQGAKLSKSQFHKFQDKLKNMSDKERIEELKEPLEEVKQTITQKEIGEKTLETMSDTISKGFETKIVLGMSLGVKAGILAAMLIAGGFLFYFLMFSPSNEELSLGVPELVTGNNTCKTVVKNNTCKACDGTGEITCPKCGGDSWIDPEDYSNTSMSYQQGGGGDVAMIRRIICDCEDGKVTCESCGGDGKYDPGDPGYTT